MLNTDAYALQRSDLNRFLFADVGEEASGMSLSVLSGLARLGLDPWQEAARLAKLPPATAIDALARMISTTPASQWSMPEATVIATRLVALLPARGSGAALAARAQPIAAAGLIARAKTLLETRRRGGSRNAAGPQGASQAGGRLMIGLAVAAILLCGLAWNLASPHPESTDGDTVRATLAQPAAPAPAPALARAQAPAQTPR